MLHPHRRFLHLAKVQLRYVVYNQTPDVWIVNDAHVKKYKAVKQNNYPQGKAVGYKGTNPNKALGRGNGKKVKGRH